MPQASYRPIIYGAVLPGNTSNTVGINYKTLNAAAAPSTSASWRPLRHPEAEYISL